MRDEKTERYLARLAPTCERPNEGWCRPSDRSDLLPNQRNGRLINLFDHNSRFRPVDAWEEAGVAGKAKKRALGYFTYLKTLDDGHKTASAVEVFRLKVDELHHEFPERGEREVAWLSPVEAARRVQEPELKGLLMRMLKDSHS